jgi:cytochrome d ubiquinol oxidase subunit I
MEAHWETQRGAPLILFAIPDAEAEHNRAQLAIPKLGSLILTHSLDGEVRGLKSFPRDQRPPVAPVFYAFRVMVGLGLAMLAVALLGLMLWWRGRVVDARWYLRIWVAMAPAGFIAVLAGWYTAEIGRQAYVIYGLLRTADAVSVLDPRSVLASLIVLAAVYAIVFGAGLWFLAKLIRTGPMPKPPQQPALATPARPLSAATAEPEP